MWAAARDEVRELRKAANAMLKEHRELLRLLMP